MTRVPRTCKVDLCLRRHYARGYCNSHYLKFRSEGLFLTNGPNPKCNYSGCESVRHAQGLCKKHYDQTRKTPDDLKSILKWQEENPEKAAEAKVRYRENNRERLRANARDYQKSNPDVQERSRRKRRAVKMSAFVESFTADDVVKVYGTDCHICLEPIDMKAPRRVGPPGWERGLHVDHVISLAKGGAHSMDNSRPSHGLCNLQKGKR